MRAARKRKCACGRRARREYPVSGERRPQRVRECARQAGLFMAAVLLAGSHVANETRCVARRSAR